MEIILMQLFGTIQLLACIIAIFQKEKKNLLASLYISNLAAIIMYFLGNSTAGVILSTVCLIRTFIYHIYAIKNIRVPFHLFMTFFLIILLLSILTYSSTRDLFMIAATLLAAYITYQPNMTVLRFGYVLNTICLIIFNMLVSAYVAAISETIFLSSTILSILKYDFKLFSKRKKDTPQ